MVRWWREKKDLSVTIIGSYRFCNHHYCNTWHVREIILFSYTWKPKTRTKHAYQNYIFYYVCPNQTETYMFTFLVWDCKYRESETRSRKHIPFHRFRYSHYKAKTVSWNSYLNKVKYTLFSSSWHLFCRCHNCSITSGLEGPLCPEA